MSKKKSKLVNVDLPGMPQKSMSDPADRYDPLRLAREAMRLSQVHVQYYHSDTFSPDVKCRICRSLKKTLLKGY